ncbi:hypothetical protein CCR75_003500 [Bremia lactucae]|uniref:Secreted protein n=1 Tax=Bremia lactucae TaxID=4779 RepID=A0A976FQM4_BRELC|nr:hypothetical protein CCR75_003500 [Bremia lactucae]
MTPIVRVWPICHPAIFLIVDLLTVLEESLQTDALDLCSSIKVESTLRHVVGPTALCIYRLVRSPSPNLLRASLGGTISTGIPVTRSLSTQQSSLSLSPF